MRYSSCSRSNRNVSEKRVLFWSGGVCIQSWLEVSVDENIRWDRFSKFDLKFCIEYRSSWTGMFCLEEASSNLLTETLLLKSWVWLWEVRIMLLASQKGYSRCLEVVDKRLVSKQKFWLITRQRRVKIGKKAVTEAEQIFQSIKNFERLVTGVKKHGLLDEQTFWSRDDI